MKWLGYLWCAFTLLALLSVRANPARFGYFSLLGTAMPWLLIGLFFLLFFWRKSRLILLPIGCFLMCWSDLTAFVGWHFITEKSTQKSVRIVTWNIGALWSYRENAAEIAQHQTDFFNFIKKKARPDIFCTQEVGSDFIPIIARETEMGYFCQVLGRQTAIFSKFPIEKSGEIKFEKTANSAVWADLKLPSGNTIRVFCAHLQSNKVSGDADKLAENDKIDPKEAWYEVRGIFSKVNQGTKKRSRQAKILAEYIDQSPFPAVLCGDLNDTPHSFTYFTLTKNLADPFRKHGFGLATSYRGSIPLLRIDYVLPAEKIPTLNYQTLKPGLGDHNPVFCEINF